MMSNDKMREALELPNFIYSDPIGHAYTIEVAGDIAREALEFYADPTNWVSGDVPGHVYAIEDAGGIAREALKSQPKMEPVGWWDGDSRFTRHETLPQKHNWDIVYPLYIVPPAATSEAPNKWRPMESAPKGGGAEYVTDPNWVDPPQILIKFEDAISVGRWDWYYADGGSGCTDGVAWIEPVSGEPLNQHYGDPVGWMPLPETDQ